MHIQIKEIKMKNFKTYESVIDFLSQSNWKEKEVDILYDEYMEYQQNENCSMLLMDFEFILQWIAVKNNNILPEKNKEVYKTIEQQFCKCCDADQGKEISWLEHCNQWLNNN